MTPLLSILIPTVVGRENELMSIVTRILGFNTLAHDFKEDIVTMKYSDFEIIYFRDNKEITIGEKRERLYKYSSGLYSWQIDDDDDISDNAIELILNAIKSNPDVDVISFEERVRLDGIEYRSNHSNLYGVWEGDGSRQFEDGFHFHRTIFFKDVIRTELAKSVPIVHCRYGEDNLYADDLKPFIKSEFHIDQQLYYYNYISTPHDERYGINK